MDVKIPEQSINKNNEDIMVDKSLSLSVIFDVGTKSSALLLGVVYICGFLSLNSHFYKYGGIDLGIVSSEYLVAGSIFVLYLATYALFGGRAIFFMKTWMAKHIDHLTESNAPPIAPYFAFIHSFIELVFFHCLSAAIFSTYAFDQSESNEFYAALFGVFIISYTLDITNFDIRNPFTHTIIDSTLKAFAVYSFFNLSSSLNMFTVFITFGIFSFFINMLLDSIERYKITNDRIIFNTVLIAVFFLGSAVLFGSSIYGNVSAKIGGGKSIEMEVGINRKSLGILGEEYGSSVVGNLIYSSPENIYLEINKKTVVLPRRSIQWLRYEAEEENDFLKTLVTLKNDKKIGGNVEEQPK